jgi:hypothetical protein
VGAAGLTALLLSTALIATHQFAYAVQQTLHGWK